MQINLYGMSVKTGQCKILLYHERVSQYMANSLLNRNINTLGTV
jgi:hypothetical protein